ncbi:MAG: hypothetical protein U9P42_07040, partial [Candidatus Fermentibacteria bacterium]|nr:hypothetical protein [Candidatus Fermentibacteria bacterium]
MSSIVMVLVFLLFGSADDPLPAGPVFGISVNNIPLQQHMMAFVASPGRRMTLSCTDSLSWSITDLDLTGTGTEFS